MIERCRLDSSSTMPSQSWPIHSHADQIDKSTSFLQSDTDSRENLASDSSESDRARWGFSNLRLTFFFWCYWSRQVNRLPNLGITDANSFNISVVWPSIVRVLVSLLPSRITSWTLCHVRDFCQWLLLTLSIVTFLSENQSGCQSPPPIWVGVL